MTRFTRLEVLGAILEIRVVPIFNTGDPALARAVVTACSESGARVVEFTNRGVAPYPLFTELRTWAAREHPEVILGAGTIFDAPTAALYIAAGADFLVSSILSPDVARLCNRRKVAYMPGCGSATEISAAEELGMEVVKLFPAAALGGTTFLRALLGPSPWSSIVPTGVAADEETIRGWFAAGAAAVGVGPGLISDELVAGGDTTTLRARLSEILGWARPA